MIVSSVYRGGRRLMLGSAILGALGLLATLLGALTNPRDALFSYLFAYAHFAGIAAAGLILLTTFHASKARWPVVLRRPLEVVSESCIVFVPLFVPIALGAGTLFQWVSPRRELGPHALDIIEHQAAYLNVPFFIVRAVLFLGLWALVGHLLLRWSREQDRTGDLLLTVKQRRLSAASLPFIALTFSFAAIDWLMSLDPVWYSTLFGVYYFAGAFLAVNALVAMLAAVRDPAEPLFAPFLNPAHYASVGKFLLAFVAFWAYIAFDQFMLIWIADLPDEVRWYAGRWAGGWKVIALAIPIGLFVVPFFALLSRKVTRNPPRLAGVALFVFLVHFLESYWIVLPALHPDGPHFHWTNLTAPLGIGGLWVAYAIFRLRGGYPVPVRDPYLRHSLRYKQQ
jgi:hypothetical protein